MVSRLTPRAISGGVFACFWLLAASDSASAQSIWQEYRSGTPATLQLGPRPVDTATTFNNNRAATRYADPAGNNSEVITIWDLNAAGVPAAPIAFFGGGTMKTGNRTSLGSNLWLDYQPSDRIEMNNIRSVSIGSGNSGMNPGFGDDETYIEVVKVGAATPTMFPQLVISPTAGSWPGTRAGLANDVALTRDGAWAVINSNNWIHVVEIAGGTVPTDYDFNIGSFDYSGTDPVGSIRPCTPNHAVDSVAVSNDRAVVTTARMNTSIGGYTTWVYILDLSVAPPVIVLEHELLPTFAIGDGDFPHDVVITVDGLGIAEMAIVTTTHTVAAFNLATNSFMNEFPDVNDRRSYQKQVDSVEANQKGAVVISDHYDPSTGLTQWRVDVYGVSMVSGLVPSASYKTLLSNQGETHAHDLAIHLEYDKAIVRTSFENIIIPSVSNPPVFATSIVSPNSSDAYAYEGFRGLTGQDVFSSDSVMIAPPVNGTLMAATLGGWQDASSIWHGRVDVIDLALLSPTVTQVSIDSSGGPTFPGCVPLDLAVSHDHTEVVVRSADPFPDTAPALGADLVRISLASPAITFSYGGQGFVMGLDSIATQASGDVNTSKRVQSISHDPITNIGYVHIAH